MTAVTSAYQAPIQSHPVRVKPGRILFEVDGVPAPLAREALELAAAKLPVKTRFIERIAE